MVAWIRRLRIRRIERAIAREKALAQRLRTAAFTHEVRAASWRMVLKEVLDG